MRIQSYIFGVLFIALGCNDLTEQPQVIIDPGANNDTAQVFHDPRMGVPPFHQPEVPVTADTVVIKSSLDSIREQFEHTFKGILVHERWYRDPIADTSLVEYDTSIVEFTPAIDSCAFSTPRRYRISNLLEIYSPGPFCFNESNFQDNISNTLFYSFYRWEFSWDVPERSITTFYRKQSSFVGPPFYTIFEKWTYDLTY